MASKNDEKEKHLSEIADTKLEEEVTDIPEESEIIAASIAEESRASVEFEEKEKENRRTKLEALVEEYVTATDEDTEGEKEEISEKETKEFAEREAEEARMDKESQKPKLFKMRIYKGFKKNLINQKTFISKWFETTIEVELEVESMSDIENTSDRIMEICIKLVDHDMEVWIAANEIEADEVVTKVKGRGRRG